MLYQLRLGSDCTTVDESLSAKTGKPKLEEKSICGNGKEAHQALCVVLVGRLWIVATALRFVAVLEGENESLSQSRVCSVRSYCLFAGDTLPTMQMGLEEPSARQRDRDSAEAGPAGSFRELIQMQVAVTSQYLHSTSLRAPR